MATPEWFAKLKRRTAEIIDFENDALERDMVRTQETPSETHETEEDIARRVRLERERQEEEEIAARLHEWNSRNVSRVSPVSYTHLDVYKRQGIDGSADWIIVHQDPTFPAPA